MTLGSKMKPMIAADRYYYKYPDTDRNHQFVQNYKDEYGEIPSDVAEETFACVHGLNEAAKKAGGASVDNLASGLNGLSWEAPEGTKQMRKADHQVIDEHIWTGKIGPVDGQDFYGYTKMNAIPGKSVTPEPTCNL
ncbi:MAG: ABC transporter substrate-binding protein [Salinigranum sp.]